MLLTSVGADLVGAATGPGDHVLDAFHVGALQHATDELEFAGARLAVALGHCPDRAVVLNDAKHAPFDLLPAREVAVLVEDAGELGDLGAQRALRRQPLARVVDARLAPLGKEVAQAGWTNSFPARCPELVTSALISSFPRRVSLLNFRLA